MKKNNMFLPSLTGYRAIAAWMVFLYHFTPYNNPQLPKVFKNFFSELHVGVDFFFVLSGFLITYRYYSSTIDFKQYLINRFARIYPIFLLVICVTYLSYWITNNSINWTEFFFNITLLKTFSDEYIFSGVMQSWTLTLEELFYFSAPFFFILVRKSKNYFWIIPIIIILFGQILKYLFSTSPLSLFQTNTSIFIIDFFVGIGIALMLFKNNGEFKKSFYTYLGIILFLMYGLFSASIVEILDWHKDVIKICKTVFLSVFCIGPILYGLIKEKTIVSKLLSHPKMILLGKSSYVFYLIHMGVIANFIYNNITSNKLLIFVLLNGLSILIFKYLEEPLNKIIRNQ